MNAARALAALLAVLPARRPYAACLTARTPRVIADADAASREHGVPVGRRRQLNRACDTP